MTRILWALALSLLASMPAGHAEVPNTRIATLARGVNIIDVFSTTPMVRIFADLQQIRSAGLRHVRIFVDPDWVMSWRSLKGSRLDQVVVEAVKDRLGVILCMNSAHHPLDDHATADVVSQWTQAWRALSGYFARSEPSALIFFELANEPTMAPDRWNGVQDALRSAVRKVAPDNTILLSGSPYSTVWGLGDLAPVGDDDVAYAIHLYQPMPFTHQGAEWDKRFTAIKRLDYPPDPTNIAAVERGVPQPIANELSDYQKTGADAMNRELAFAAKTATERHLHLVVTEFGVYRTAPPSSRAQWLQQARQTIETDGFGWTVWEFNGGFGIQPDLAACTAVVRALGLRCIR